MKASAFAHDADYKLRKEVFIIRLTLNDKNNKNLNCLHFKRI